MTQDFFNQTFLGNSVGNYCWLAGILLTGLLFKKLISLYLSKLIFQFLKKYSEGVNVDHFTFLLSTPIKFFILVIASFLAFDRLEFPTEWKLVPVEQFGLRMTLFKIFYVLVIVSVTWIMLRMADFLAIVFIHKSEKKQTVSNNQLISFAKEGVKIILASLSFLFILGSVFHFNITSLIAGLGIGGLAFALAAKETIENLLGSFTIFADQPFVVGDLIKVGGITGTVEKIGFRSTRLRTPEKSYVTVPNKKMVDAETENLSLRTSRIAHFNIPLAVNSNQEKVKNILKEIRIFLQNHILVNKDDVLVRFAEINLNSLDLLVHYYVLTTDNAEFMKVKEEVNLTILDIVSKNGCELASQNQNIYSPKS